MFLPTMQIIRVIWHKPFPKYDRLIECCLASSGEQFSSIYNESKMTTDVNKRMGLKKNKKKRGGDLWWTVLAIFVMQKDQNAKS